MRVEKTGLISPGGSPAILDPPEVLLSLQVRPVAKNKNSVTQICTVHAGWVSEDSVAKVGKQLGTADNG